MDPKRFAELKHKVVEENNFSVIWNFYMDHFTDLSEFTDMGKPARNKFLDEAIPVTCQEMFQKKVKVTLPLTISIPEYKFFHGPLQVGKRIGGFLYFEDICVGMIAVSAHFPPTDLVKYSRFTEKFRLSMNKPMGFG
jgi:hypothetical protein